ncbi:MAG: glycerophosphodiester phosphodiesterase [Thalassobius sp.]|nr:glycerophosphodiester phosphodiesterase [Thalassovita sp.]
MKALSKIVVICLLSLAVSCQNQITQEREMSINKSMVVAHRGASHYAPENTVASAKLAWEQNADAVEVDVHLSLDSQIIVMHDYNTERTCGEKFVIKETATDKLKTLDAGSFKDEKYVGEPVPLLAEIIETIPAGKLLFIEIKSEKNIVPILKEQFGNDPKKDQFVFIAFDYETIVDTKKAFPENKAYWLSSKFKEDANTIMQRVKDDGLDGVDLSQSIVTPEIMQIAESKGLEVHCWTVNSMKKAKELNELGVQGITTNKPDSVLAVLN